MAKSRLPDIPADGLILSITLSRIPLAILFAVLLLHSEGTLDHQTGVLFACGAILGLIEVSDLLDGLLARVWSRASEWGAILDPYSDSLSRLIVFWSLARAELALGGVPLVMAIRDVTVAYARIILIRQRASVSARLSGKVKAVVQGAAGLLLLFGPLYWPLVGSWPMTALSWLVALVTGLSAIEYVLAAVQSTRRS